jgi:CRP-like cAMP-binding protein
MRRRNETIQSMRPATASHLPLPPAQGVPAVKLDPAAFAADPELLAALETHSLPIHCSEERILFLQGESPAGLYILRAGSASLLMTSPTGEQIVDTPVFPGALLGLPGVIGNQPYTLTGIAGKGAEFGFVSTEDFSRLMLSDPALSLKVLRVLAAEVRAARGAITES